MWICLRGSEFYMCIIVLDQEPSQSLTTIHRHFHTPTSLRPCHFDSHTHFSSPFLVLETQNLEPSRTKKTSTVVSVVVVIGHRAAAASAVLLPPLPLI